MSESKANTKSKSKSQTPHIEVQRTEDSFLGEDGVDLYLQSWSSKSPRATLVVTHGIGEHSDCYDRFASGMAAYGFKTWAWDLRGHGRSSGNRGTIGKFLDYAKDLDRLMKFLKEKDRLQGPVFAVGHSMGGLVLTLKLIDSGSEGFQGAILSSPLFGIGVRVPEVKEQAARWVSQFLPGLTLHNEINYEDLTHDRSVSDGYEQDVLRHDRISTGLFVEMLSTIEYVKKNLDRVRIPLLIQAAGDERIVSRPATEKAFEGFGSNDKTLKVYEGLLHEVYNETARQTVYRDLSNWLEIHL